MNVVRTGPFSLGLQSSLFFSFRWPASFSRRHTKYHSLIPRANSELLMNVRRWGRSQKRCSNGSLTARERRADPNTSTRLPTPCRICWRDRRALLRYSLLIITSITSGLKLSSDTSETRSGSQTDTQSRYSTTFFIWDSPALLHTLPSRSWNCDSMRHGLRRVDSCES